MGRGSAVNDAAWHRQVVGDLRNDSPDAGSQAAFCSRGTGCQLIGGTLPPRRSSRSHKKLSIETCQALKSVRCNADCFRHAKAFG